MIQTNYNIAFRLEVFHSYFENNLCKCLKFNIAPNTVQLAKRFGFNTCNNINGFDFYYSTKASLVSLLDHVKAVTGQSFFEFDIQCSDSSFNNFTEIPVDWMGQLLFDSASGINQFKNNILTLGTNLSEKAYSTATGKLTIHFDDLLKYSNGKGYTHFNISLHARNTQWQYFVINKTDRQFANPAIIGEGNIEFDLPQTVTIPSGQKALLFSSGKNLIGLSKIPKYKFALVDKPGLNKENTTAKTTTKILFKGLPNPDPERISIININGNKQASSPMYIFL